MEKFQKILRSISARRTFFLVILLILLLLLTLVYASLSKDTSTATSIAADAVCATVAVLIAINCMREEERDATMRIFVWLTWYTFGFIIMDLLGWVTLEARAPSALQYIADISEMLIGYIATMTFTRYLREFIGIHHKWLRIAYKSVFVLGILFSAAFLVTLPWGLPFSVVNRIYVRGPLYALFQSYPIIVLVMNQGVILKSQRLTAREKVSLSTYCLAPLVALPLQFLHYGVAATGVSLLISLVIVYNNIYMQRSKILMQQDQELTQSRVQLMVSQIQPHFLYNTLTSIANICEKDPKAARQAIVDFSDYLRVNLDSLKCQKNVPFTRELEHCQTYLNFEKMRFEEDLNIEYDVQVTDFAVPILSVQPLLENAVKHGICNKAGGGTVRLTTYRQDEVVYIIIEDDGVGFDTTSTHHDDSRQHIGLENVRYRLQQMCGGEMTVESVPGKGTKVTITLPNERGD